METREQNYQAMLDTHGTTLLKLAHKSIETGLETGQPLEIDVKDFAAPLREKGAVFVTINKNNNLRGCIGSPMAYRPLAQDVAENAFAAAFHDPRFGALRTDELGEVSLSISVLTPPEPLPFDDKADLLAKIQPNKDGLILSEKGRRGLFLPIVWEQLPTAELFLSHLLQKAGLPSTYWSDTIKIERFGAVAVKE